MNHESTIDARACSLRHDPTPWITYSMAASAQATWSRPARLKPRPGYCQIPECYQPHEPETEQ